MQSKVELLLGGAADYITKPFEMKELLAGKAKLLADALAACDAAVVCDAPAADADAAVEEQEAEAEAEIPAETAAVSHEDADVRTPESIFLGFIHIGHRAYHFKCLLELLV